MNGFSVCSFTMGSQRLYDFVHNNPSVLFKSSTFSNDPYTIARNNKFVSVNASLEIDLTGQCASETVGNLQWSGTGGQSETVQARSMSPGGKSIIAMHSTYFGHRCRRQRGAALKNCPLPGAGRRGHHFQKRHRLRGHGVWYRLAAGTEYQGTVEALVKIAHPDFRDWLREEAERNMIW